MIEAGLGGRGVVFGLRACLVSGDALGEREPAGDVVVVDVRLEHVGDLYPCLLGDGEDPVVVALWVHHEGNLAVMGEVGPVSETGGVDRGHGDHAHCLLRASGSYPWGYRYVYGNSQCPIPSWVFPRGANRAGRTARG